MIFGTIPPSKNTFLIAVFFISNCCFLVVNEECEESSQDIDVTISTQRQTGVYL